MVNGGGKYLLSYLCCFGETGFEAVEIDESGIDESNMTNMWRFSSQFLDSVTHMHGVKKPTVAVIRVAGILDTQGVTPQGGDMSREVNLKTIPISIPAVLRYNGVSA